MDRIIPMCNGMEVHNTARKMQEYYDAVHIAEAKNDATFGSIYQIKGINILSVQTKRENDQP